MISGYGIHSGSFSKVFFHHSDKEVSFLKNNSYIPAKLSSVVSTPRSTVLGKNNQNIAVVEHLLAAIHSLNIWTGLLIEVQGDELPILDGSAIEWYYALKDLNIQSKIPKALTIGRTIEHKDNNSILRALPGKQHLSVEIDYNHKAIGKQSWSGTQSDYKQLLDARTFGFLAEAQELQSAGLATRASLENVIIFDDVGAMQKLRYQNEPVRHKAVDAIGDLYLIGKPLKAELEIIRGSHKTHVEFAKKLLKEESYEEY